MSAHVDDRLTSSSGDSDSDWPFIVCLALLGIVLVTVILSAFYPPRGTEDDRSSKQTVALITFGKRVPVYGASHLCSDGNVLTVEIVRDQETRKITLANPQCELLTVEQ